MNKEIIIAGKKIRYRVTGAGKRVLLVHGFGETGDVWNNQAGYLQTKAQLIVPDLPGSGASDSIDNMSMEGMADVLKIILDTELSDNDSSSGQAEGVVLIGHSMGGYISLAFAEKYPNYLNAFGLFHSTAYADTDEKKATREKGISFINEHGAFEFLKTTSPNLFSSFTKSANQSLIDNFIQSLNNFSSKSLVSYYRAMINRPDRTQILTNSKIPMLFIMGETDNAIPFQDMLKQSHLPEKSYIHILRKSGHMGMLEEADSSNNMLEKFIGE